jgi:amino acid adenylation domain-containing protein
MTIDLTQLSSGLPPAQAAIRAQSFQSAGAFTEFQSAEVEQSVPARFEKMARQYPDRIAIKMGPRALTYDQLNRAANRIAHALLARRGAGSESIPLLIEDALDAVVALFGVLKAGKFYLALDPSYPRERISHMVEDSGASLIVTKGRASDLAYDVAADARSVLNIDEIDGSISEDNPGLPISPSDRACILYTSGSTGKPKGFVCPHRNILCTAAVHGQLNHICTDDRLTLLHSVSVGAAHMNLFQSLLNGASLFPFDIKSRGTHRLADWLNEERITVFHSSPSVFRQLSESLQGGGQIPTLRLLNLSGAPVSKSDIEHYRKLFAPGALLEISIGATETHKFASFIVDADFQFPARGVPGGYAWPGKEILILDENGCELKRGQEGEIAVRSDYLNPAFQRAPRAARHSLPLGRSNEDERIYLTGDLGTMNPDGFLIHLGRKDFVTKLRGFRVSLGEVEAVLRDHPGIVEAAVMAWDRDGQEKLLAAYIVPRDESTLTADEISTFVRARLPDYMAPSRFVFLESLPLTNGKVDRRSLPLPDRTRPRLDNDYAPPRSEIDRQLVHIWEKVLEVRPIGIHDNFFHLGGHSLAATRVISLVLQKFQLELPIKALFESPTVAAMATVILQHQANNEEPSDLERILNTVEAMSDEEAERVIKNLTGKLEQ